MNILLIPLNFSMAQRRLALLLETTPTALSPSERTRWCPRPGRVHLWLWSTNPDDQVY
jgi:hypothetical protein